MIDALGKQCILIAPDLRGDADSDTPYDGHGPHSIADDVLT